MMFICIKQHLSNIWSSVHEKFKQHWGWVEKALLIKKRVEHNPDKYAFCFLFFLYLNIKIPFNVYRISSLYFFFSL